MANVFIGSTSKDLTDYRQAATEVCLKLGLFPIAMKFFAATGKGATDGSKAKLDGADVYVGIFAHRYGYIEDGYEKSVTEIEFDYARERKLEPLCFLLDPKHPWPPDTVDHENYPRLKKFKARISKLIRAKFTTVDSFRAALMQALVEWKARAGVDQAGVKDEKDEDQEEGSSAPPVLTFEAAHERNPYFTGRDEILNELRETLERDGKAALSGLPGVGKTQTAREYAHRHRGEYDKVLWVTADSEESLGLGFASLARELDLPEKDEKDQSVAVDAAKHWLATNEGWLLILDNADDLVMARPFVPSGGKGHTLLTTRASATGAIAGRVEVSKMGPEEGALFLLRRAKVISRDAELNAAPQAEREAAEKLCGEVGGLPLALDQAGAFVEENQIALEEYLDLYRAEGRKLRAERGELAKEHDSVAVTFSLAFQKVAGESPAGADLMRLCAFLAPDAIPEEVITEGASGLMGPDAGALGFLEAVKAAGRYSLIERHGGSKTLEVHRLVQDVVRDGMDEETRREWAERAVSAVSGVFPNAADFETWLRCERLLAHARSVVGLIDEYGFESDAAAGHTVRTGFYLMERAQYDEAQQLYTRSLTICESLYGPESAEVAIRANNIGQILQAQGDLAGALEYTKRALAIDEKVYGPEHPRVAIRANNIGQILKAQGDLAGALEYTKRALAIGEKVHGPEHPHVAGAANNIGQILKAQGDLARALEYTKRALAIDEKVYGPEHPQVAIFANNMGQILKAQGDLAGALEFTKRALAIDEKVYGPEHPDVARDVNNIGTILRDQGDLAGARAHFDRALRIFQKFLGDDHPNTQGVRRNLEGLGG